MEIKWKKEYTLLVGVMLIFIFFGCGDGKGASSENTFVMDGMYILDESGYNLYNGYLYYFDNSSSSIVEITINGITKTLQPYPDSPYSVIYTFLYTSYFVHFYPTENVKYIRYPFNGMHYGLSNTWHKGGGESIVFIDK